MGFLGILEDTRGAAIPGTIILDEGVALEQRGTSGLKHGKGSHSHTVLAPQPSDDPNDPLNFSQAKKLLMMGITAFGTTIFGATIPPLLNAGLFEISIDLHVTLPDIVLVSGYQLLVVACSIPIVNAFARRWGKRPVFLGSGIFGLIGSLIGSVASNYDMLLAARIIQGFSSSAYESLVLSMIGDLFFVHERGLYTSIITFMLATVSNFSSIICGPIVSGLGWRYLFRFLVLFGGLQTILQFLFVPETQFRRDHRYDIDETGNLDTRTAAQQVRGSQPSPADIDDEKQPATATNLEQVTTAQTIPPKKTFTQQLAVYNGVYSRENLFQLMISPFAVFLNVAVAWAILIGGFYLSLYVAVAFLLAQIFSAPPYLFNAREVGYLFTGPFIGGLISSVILGLVSDRVIRWCIRKNNGVYEPEYRLLLCPVGLLTIAGFISWGYVVQNQGSVYLAIFLHGLGLFGITFVLVTTANYCLDAYREMSSEIFLASMCVKNILIYGYSYFVNTWAIADGPLRIFVVLGSVAAAFMLFLPVFIVFGKRYRGWWSRNNLMKKFKILTHEE